MSIIGTAVVDTTGTTFVDGKVSALRKAYGTGDTAEAFRLSEALLAYLGEYPDETNPLAAGAARLFRGWAYLTQALAQRGKSSDYPTTLQRAFDDLDKALYAFLANNDTLVERITAEGYLAYTKCLLGMNDQADQHLTYMEYAVGGGSNLGAMSVFLRIKIAIMKLRGEITTEHAPATPTTQAASARVVPEPEELYVLPSYIKEQLHSHMAANEPEQVLALTEELMQRGPHTMQAVTAAAIRQARIWALMAAGRRTRDPQLRSNYFHEVAPLLRVLIDYNSRPDNNGNATQYVTNMLNLVYVLYSLGSGHDNEAQSCMATVMAYVAQHGDRRLRRELEAARVQIDGVVLQRSCVPA